MAQVQAKILMERDLPVYLDTPAIRGAFERIGVPVEYAAPNFNLWLHTVSGIESSFGKNLSNKERVGESGTSAKGTYQIVDGTYLTMLNRAARSYKMAGAEVPSYITKAQDDPNRDPRDLTENQEKELILLDMEQRPQKDENGVGTSILMRDLAMGDWDAGRSLFDNHHHTNPDKDTTKRADDFFNRFAGDVTEIVEQPEPVRASEIEQYADLNNPEKEPSIPAQQLGNLNIEDYNPEPSIAAQSLTLPSFDFEEANRQGMLSSLGVDVPERGRVVVPQPSLAGTEFDFIQRREREKERQRMMASLGVDMPTAKRVTVPQPSLQGTDLGLARRREQARQRQMDSLQPVTPTQRGQVPIPQPRQPAPDARLASESQPNLEAMIAAQQDQAMNSVVRPSEPASAPVLEEVVPTQRGQVPIPQRPPVEPERVVGFEPNLESELASEMLKPLPPELEEIDLSTIPKSVAQSYERVETPAVVQDRRAEARSRIPKMPTQEERREAARSRIPTITGVSNDPDPRTGDERKFDRNRDTILTGATLGAYDEVAGFLNSAFAGTPYAETVGQIRKNVSEQRLMNPTTALFQEAIPGLITGGGLAGQLIKRGVGLGTAAGAEGAFTGAMYGETPAERAGMAVLLGTVGGTIGGAIGWATTRSSKATASIDGARTPSDNLADDELLTITIDQAIEAGNTVKYRTNNGTLKTVEVQQVLDNGNVQIKDGTNVYAVPKVKIERVNVGKTSEGALREAEEIGQFIDVSRPFTSRSARQDPRFDVYKQDEYAYALNAEQQMKLLDDNYTGALNIDQKAKRFSYIDEKPYTKGRKADYKETDWRNAQTPGEFLDGIKDLMKRFYNDKLVGASDYLQKISPEIGAKFQRFSETALRTNDLAFRNVIEPMEKMIKGLDEDRMLKAMVMDYTHAVGLAVRKNMEVTAEEVAIDAARRLAQINRYIGEKYGEEQVTAFGNYLKWNRMMKERHAKYINGERGHQNRPVVHIHTQLTPEKKAEKFKTSTREFRDNFEVTDDSAKEFRSRPSLVDDLNNNGSMVDDYLNPILTDFRRTANYENLNQMARVYGLPETVVEQQPHKMFGTLRTHFIERGASPEDATIMANIIKDDFVGQSRSPNNWIQFLNSWGYAGSLAGPKSAVLNLHDIPMAAVLYGPSSFKGVFKKMGYSVEDKGIRQNVGEFMNYMQEQLNSGPASISKQAADMSRKGTDLLMRGSLFAWMDGVGKNAITRMIVQDAVDNVDKLRSKWGFYFSESELNLIEKQIRKHGTNVGEMTGKGAELFEELFFAGLGQQQLISSAGRPAAWARNPNLRPLWALRGFAIKQLALAQRNIFDNIANGNKKAAYDYMMRYALFSAGGFGLMNETRQWIWGDGNFTASGVLVGFADQIVATASINTIGLNDYQWGKMMEDGVVRTWLRSLVPIGLDIPLDTITDVVDALDKEDKGWQTPITELPIIDQWSKFFNNVEDDLGIIPQPMDQFSRQFIQQEQPDG